MSKSYMVVYSKESSKEHFNIQTIKAKSKKTAVEKMLNLLEENILDCGFEIERKGNSVTALKNGQIIEKFYNFEACKDMKELRKWLREHRGI